MNVQIGGCVADCALKCYATTMRQTTYTILEASSRKDTVSEFAMQKQQRKRMSLDKLETGFVVAVVLFSIVGCVLGVWAVSHPPVDLPIAVANPTPVASTGPTTQLVTSARLGGPLSAFDAAYGPEVDKGTWNTKVAGYRVQLLVSTTPYVGDSKDGQKRVLSISITGLQESTWTEAQTMAVVQSFLPPDALHTQTISGSDTSGPDNIYTSQQLTNSIDASMFVNTAHFVVAPGTFDWHCTYGTPFCYVAVGTNS